MKGLSGVRVIVVDDDEEEALPVLKAFAKRGIPTAFFDGSRGGLPRREDRLAGVRLAILDMDLIGGGASEKSKAAALARLLEEILSPNNGPHAVLAWTKHQDLPALFESYVHSRKKIPSPIFLSVVTKAECRTKSGAFSLSVVAKKLEEALVQTSPLLLLQAWEEKCFNAATEVTNSLSMLTQPLATDLNVWRTQWKSQLLNLMHAMAEAEMEKHLDCETCLEGLYGALNPLHADRMESHSAKPPSASMTSSSNEVLNAPTSCTTSQKARVNTMLHLCFENLDRLSAGNMYVFGAKKKPDWVPGNKELAQDMVSSAPGQKEVARLGRRVLVEVSAVCDHAQKNLRNMRFVGGLLVPATERNKLKRADFIWKFGPVHLRQPVIKSGEYYLYLSARHQVTLQLRDASGLKAVTRLRSQALADLQAWYSQRSARPGMMMLSER